jgi:DNA-binding beta-propeller fold protein YncE
MNDFERLLRDSLRKAGEVYSPHDPAAARERFLARRRRRRVRIALAGTGLATATAAAALIFLAPGTAVDEPQRVRPAASGDKATITATIPTGDQPSGVAVGAGSVWVTNVASDRVTQIDPATQDVVETFDVPGGPDDVAITENTVWVSTNRGSLWRLARGGNSFEEFNQRPGIGGVSGHLDIAAEGRELFVQVDGGPLVIVEESGGSPEQERYVLAGEATDVAVHGDLVWVYERSEERVVRFDRATGERLGETPVGDADSQDLAATENYGWFFRGSDATLIQIRAEDGEAVKEVRMKGTFGAISPASDGVWVMTATSRSGEGTLYRVRSDGAEQIDTPVLLGGLPYDVASGPEGIWITNHDAGTVTRIDLVPADAPDPPEPGPDAQVIFYYSAAGDIFAYRADGSSEPVAATSGFESNPAISPSGKTLLYQEARSGKPARIRLVALEDEIYPAGVRETLLEGEWPAFSPTGELAWVDPGDSATATMIGIGAIASEPRLEFEIPSEQAVPYSVRRLAWGPSEEELLFEGEVEDRSLYSLEVPPSPEVAPKPSPISGGRPGELLISPAVHPQVGTTAIRLCCTDASSPDLTSAELGLLTEEGFEKIMGLEDLGLVPGSAMFAAPAGTLSYEETSGWSNGSSPTWLVGDGDRLFLVSSEREGDILLLEGVTGAAVVSSALSED